MAYSDLDAIHVPSAGNRPPASWGVQVNANFDAVYDDVLAKLTAWTAYTPVLGQPGSVGKTVTYARYIKLGRFVTVSMFLSCTGTGNANTKVTVSLPTTAVQAGNLTVGAGAIYDSSAVATYPARMVLDSTTTAAFAPTNVTTGGYLGATSTPFTAPIASGDTFDCTFTYESTT